MEKEKQENNWKRKYLVQGKEEPIRKRKIYVRKKIFGPERETKRKKEQKRKGRKTRSSWLNCALRDDEAVYCVSVGHYEAVAVGN